MRSRRFAFGGVGREIAVFFAHVGGGFLFLELGLTGYWGAG
jgi:hypothetical protein